MDNSSLASLLLDATIAPVQQCCFVGLNMLLCCLQGALSQLNNTAQTQVLFCIVDQSCDIVQQQAAYCALNLIVGGVSLCGGHAATLKDEKDPEQFVLHLAGDRH